MLCTALSIMFITSDFTINLITEEMPFLFHLLTNPDRFLIKEKKHLHFPPVCYIISFAQVDRLERKNEGLSPNGKATDSDSVIFQVRILVALVERYSGEYLFFYTKSQKKPYFTGFFKILFSFRSSPTQLK